MHLQDVVLPTATSWQVLELFDLSHCIKYHISLCRSQGERSVITTMQAGTLEHHSTCSLHNSLDCHVHQKQIIVIFVIHKETGVPPVSTGTRVEPLDEVTFWL